MRITGGRYSGMRLDCPPGEIRPAMDRMRESVFAVLGDLTGKSFLDLFSGSGSIALEAASRGASPVVAVEKDPRKREVLQANLRKAEEPIAAKTVAAELFVRRAKEAFDLIFCDPPFPYRFRRELLKDIASSPLMAAESLLLIHFPDEDDPGTVAGLSVRDERKYGRSIVRFYEKMRLDGEETDRGI